MLLKTSSQARFLITWPQSRHRWDEAEHGADLYNPRRAVVKKNGDEKLLIALRVFYYGCQVHVVTQANEAG